MMRSNLPLPLYTSIFLIVTLLPLAISLNEPIKSTEEEPILPCSPTCNKQYTSLLEYLACARGCRFYKLIDLVARPQFDDCTKESCINTCNEAYNETDMRKACSDGCANELGWQRSNSLERSDTSITKDETEVPLFGWLHFPQIVDPQMRERIAWPFQIFNDLVRQLGNQVSSGSNWVRSQSTYTMLINDGEDNNKQNIIVIRSKSGPQLMPFDDSESNEQIKLASPESSNNVHVFSLNPSLKTDSAGSDLNLPSNKPIDHASITSSNHAVHDVNNASYKSRWFSNIDGNIFKDIRLLLAFMLLIIAFSLITMYDGFCFMANRFSRSEVPNEPPFFILDSEDMKKGPLKTIPEDPMQEELTKEANEKPPTYEETLNQNPPSLDVNSLVAHESKA